MYKTAHALYIFTFVTCLVILFLLFIILYFACNLYAWISRVKMYSSFS